MSEAPESRASGGLFRKLTTLLGGGETKRPEQASASTKLFRAENSEADSKGLGGYMELDLTPLVSFYGEEWSEVSRSAYRMIEAIITKRLSRADCYMRHGADKYFLMFKGLSEVEARLKCNFLAEEVISTLARQHSPDDKAHFTARTAVAPMVDDSPLDTCKQFIDPSVEHLKESVKAHASAARETLTKAQRDRLSTLLDALSKELGRSPSSVSKAQLEARNSRLEGMIQLLRQADEMLAGRADAVAVGGGTDGTAAAAAGEVKSPFLQLREAVAAGLQQAETMFVKSTGRQPFTPVPRGGKISGLPAPSSHRPVSGGPEWQEMPSVGQLPGWEAAPASPSAEEAPAAAPVRKSDEDTLEQADISYLYRPLWQVKANALNGYFCTMMVDDGNGVRPYQAMFAEDSEDTGRVATQALVDHLILRRALCDVTRLLELGQKCRVVASVHFTTLSSAKARRAYIEALRTIGEAARKLLILEIVYPFSASSNLPVFEAANLIRSFACALFLQVKFEHPVFDDLKSAGILAVGVDLSPLVISETELFRKYESFCDHAAKAELRSYVTGLNTRSKTTAAVCSGFNFVSGDPVGVPVNFPGGVRGFSVFDTYTFGR
ncbi:MAG: hypothetical protein WCF85_17485 [Rhodospirillaceae bacterium]